jgi:SAM-dependent methyltransferase
MKWNRVCISYSNSRNCFDWKSLLESYQKYVTKESIVIEIGASNLERTKDLNKLCKELIGIEFMPSRLPKDFDNVKYFLGDWQNLSDFIEPESIDIVVSSHVLEHVPNDLRAINELYKILKPGGMALLNTPNRKRLPRAIIEKFTGKREFPFWEHQREYTDKDLICLLDKSKFAKFNILPIAFGIHGGKVFCYIEQVPKCAKKYANFWEIQLYK